MWICFCLFLDSKQLYFKFELKLELKLLKPAYPWTGVTWFSWYIMGPGQFCFSKHWDIHRKSLKSFCATPHHVSQHWTFTQICLKPSNVSKRSDWSSFEQNLKKNLLNVHAFKHCLTSFFCNGSELVTPVKRAVRRFKEPKDASWRR
jgi:hypothetical protein